MKINYYSSLDFTEDYEGLRYSENLSNFYTGTMETLRDIASLEDEYYQLAVL